MNLNNAKVRLLTIQWINMVVPSLLLLIMLRPFVLLVEYVMSSAPRTVHPAFPQESSDCMCVQYRS
jgi:hypothetical protein